jgi:hypothetical protein
MSTDSVSKTQRGKEVREKLLVVLQKHLESLGEIMYLFHDEELQNSSMFVEMFLGGVAPEYIKRIKHVIQSTKLELAEWETIKDMTPEERGKFFMQTGIDNMLNVLMKGMVIGQVVGLGDESDDSSSDSSSDSESEKEEEKPPVVNYGLGQDAD